MRIVIIGAGGHGKVVLESALTCHALTVLGFVDEHRRFDELFGFPVFSSLEEVQDGNSDRAGGFIIGFGGLKTMRLRETRYTEFASMHLTPTSVIHEGATISRSATVSAGTFASAGTVVNASAQIGENVILNTGCIVEHDCIVGSHSHIAPRAVLLGAVTVGVRSFVGAGAVVLPGISIGDDAIIGAGSTVVENVASGKTVMGSPARPKRA